MGTASRLFTVTRGRDHDRAPYELHDFSLYYTLRSGYQPSTVAFLAYCGWHDRRQATWPDVTAERRRQYTIGEIKAWLRVFLDRFFRQSQFKRSCLPNASKVGSTRRGLRPMRRCTPQARALRRVRGDHPRGHWGDLDLTS